MKRMFLFLRLFPVLYWHRRLFQTQWLIGGTEVMNLSFSREIPLNDSYEVTGDAVAPLLPADDGVVVIIAGGEIAEEGVVHPLLDGLCNGGHRGEVHVRYPHGDDVKALFGGLGAVPAGWCASTGRRCPQSRPAIPATTWTKSTWRTLSPWSCAACGARWSAWKSACKNWKKRGPRRPLCEKAGERMR